MDSKDNKGTPDSKTINLNEDYEVSYWVSTIGVTREQLIEAVGKVGKSVEAVKEYLHK